MKTSTVTEEQIVQILREAATGDPSIVTGCRAHGIAENTVYTWRKLYGGVDVVVNRSSMSDAYEGTTVRLQPLYPLCQGSMDAGYLLDRGETNSLYQSEWAAGAPHRSRPRALNVWMHTGTVNTTRVRRSAVSMFRCDACGFLAAYATTPSMM